MIVDMHVHTKYSGHSLTEPTRVAKVALRKGIDCIGVTDHNSLKGAHEVEKLIPTIRGEEISTDHGDVVGLFLQEEIRPGELHEVLDLIHEQGGLVYLPHPFDSMRKETIAGVEPKDICDIIEVFNSRTLRKEYNLKALDYARRHNPPMGAGSDAHTSMEIGNAAVVVEEFESPEEFIRALKTAQIRGKLSFPLVHVITKMLKLLD